MDFLYLDSPKLSQVKNIFQDISEVPTNFEYDRITSVATLEHISNLPYVIAKSGLLLTKNGVFRASIPSEGTILWKLGWKVSTGLEFKIKYNLDYAHIMNYEHVNSAKEIEEILKYFFKNVNESVFGFSKSFSLYQYYECSNPILSRCNQYA